MEHTYRHMVQYYETDKMGIAHHSNYVRWMEEARVDLLSKIGWDYDRLEALGVFSPVTAVECRFRHSCTFADAVDIAITAESFSGVRLRLKYAVTGADGTLLCEASFDRLPGVTVPKASMTAEKVSLMRSERGKNGMIYTEIGRIEA